MKRTRIIEIESTKSTGEPVFVKGWVKTKRDAKELSFINLNDGTNFAGVQVVVEPDAEGFEEVRTLTVGASIAVEGVLVDSPGSNQKFEIKAGRVSVIGASDPATYPIQKKKMTLEFLRDVAHLRPRTNTLAAVFRIRHTVSFAIHEFFNGRGFKYIHTPIITASDAEGAGAMFRVTTLDLGDVPRTEDSQVDYARDFFGRQTFLTVSGQLAVENFCSALGDVYTFGPTFRAENSQTPRHLAEFWMVEPEIAFADLDDDAELAESLLKFVIGKVMRDHQDDLEFLEKRYSEGLRQRLQEIVDSTFARISYTDAVEILEKSGRTFEFPPSWGIDLQTEHERYLSEEHFRSPVIVTDYPKDIKAFYMKMNDDGRTVRAMDILFPGVGEIVGGSQREDDFEKLHKRMIELNLNPEDYDWYLDLRRYGTHPHAGFGLGLERLVQFVTGMSNIRDVIPFPRTPKNARF